jgi:hypothetical protein
MSDWAKRTREGNPFVGKHRYDYQADGALGLGAYAAFDESGAIIYVGRTKNFLPRIARHHMERSAWISEAVSIDFVPCASFGDSLVAEAVLIRDHQPKYNKDGVTG